eukprot:TRINITY_DN79110_c0_g1_i1.p1 TRINITY_DN79110_c0_g1~~TRINITY_DN79110_c0_g1_i1.p1  ORF type:complete len:452 (-),score=96.76 TRINITY_DN79110_c0_g1_i1:7-1362(-)
MSSTDGAEPEDHAHEDFVLLSALVTSISDGRLQLVDTADRGRCLVTTTDLPAGSRVRDLPVLAHGSSAGLHLIEATASGSQETSSVGSAELLAALDFLASLLLLFADAARTEDEGGCFKAEGIAGPEALGGLFRFPAAVLERVPMIRRFHKRWKKELTELVPAEMLEDAWQHVVPNWRQLTVSLPRGRRVEPESDDGPARLSLSHDVVCGLWLLMALCEHSCDPSCALAHDGKDLWFVTLRDLPAGAAVTTSYLSVGGLCRSCSGRRKELQENYRFFCACDRCRREEKDDDLRCGCLEPEELEMLLAKCSAPPAVDSDTDSYCEQLHKMQEQVITLHGRKAQPPSLQALLLLEAVFSKAGPQQQAACRQHAEACAWLFGADSAAASWAQQLCDDPAECLRSACAEASMEELEAGGSPRQILREAYNAYFLSRSWPRKRHEDGFRAAGTKNA